MGLKVQRQPLIDETRGPDRESPARRFLRTFILAKSARDTGLGYMLLVTFTASDGPHVEPEAVLQWVDGERAPLTFALGSGTLAAFMDEANAWLEQHPVKAPPTP